MRSLRQVSTLSSPSAGPLRRPCFTAGRPNTTVRAAAFSTASCWKLVSSTEPEMASGSFDVCASLSMSAAMTLVLR
ncbi:MAG: hypothetical protein ACJ8AT_14965 [Hyalangium sp.]|uniref:hypothetical protein n=1 Tax=Hyalangium sp. TaxID=2028555 RepID=UPI00389ADD13